MYIFQVFYALGLAMFKVPATIWPEYLSKKNLGKLFLVGVFMQLRL